MKKPLILAVFCVLMVAMVAFTGCIQDAKRIDGTMHNRTDQKARVEFTNKANNEQWQWGLEGNDTRRGTLEVGTYSLTAHYGYDADDYIDSTTLTIRASDSTFTIIINNETLYAESY